MATWVGGNRVPVLAEVLGTYLREEREAANLSRDEVAHAMTAWGVPWSRSKVIAVELGSRPLTAEELVVLPVAFFHLGRRLDLARAIGRAHLIEVGDGTFEGDVLADALTGGLDYALDLSHADQPATRDASTQAEQRATELKALRRWWPDGPLTELDRAERDATLEAEQRAARSLGIEPVRLSVLARRRWGRGFTEERDRRAARAPEDPASSAQALRGHAARVMLDEIRNELEDDG